MGEAMRLPVLVEPAIRRYVVVLACLFAVMAVVGWMAPEAAMAPLLAKFGELARRLRGLPQWQLFAIILANNLIKSFVSMIAGALLGFVPILSIVGNGFLLGALCRHVSHVRGTLEIVGRIAPHGVFELPAIFIGNAYGLWLGAGTLARMSGEEEVRVGERVQHAIRRFLIIVAPLLIVAAVIESSLGARLK